MRKIYLTLGEGKVLVSEVDRLSHHVLDVESKAQDDT